MVRRTAVTSGEELDRPLARQVVVLMRGGTLACVVLLIAGTILTWCDRDQIARVAITAGCAVLISLPVLRLLLMLHAFKRRADNIYTAITILVIAIIATTAALLFVHP
ncbi:DUF1634 domain-containing protein [Kribbella solani]|uniref:DUF1634 domain-containing protein n=1 Tax=Kribbella solani TaxID=236067 RepID=UPI0029B425BF|nr:DUF1634 domain-containing protein [Kribbella solani]MDX2969722.1 DUF1634 domain-containing protein [Kribbella solani]